MPSVLHFSPAFKRNLSLSDLSSSRPEWSRKRERALESPDTDGVDGGDEGLEADSATNRSSLPFGYSSAFITTSLAAPDLAYLQRDHALHSQFSSSVDHEGLHATNIPLSFPHHISETAPSMVKGRISDEIATLKPPLYVTPRRVSTATTEKTSGSTGLRQHHLNIITTVLHRCLLECDYFRAGRAWAMLLRAEQHGQSMDLRTHDRWGIGAEILLERESQMAQKTLDEKIIKISKSTSKLEVKLGSMEKAKEYYERIVLQYPYRKAFPNATDGLNFSIAMFSLWIYAIKERSSIALMAAGGSNGDSDRTDAEVYDNVSRSSVLAIEPDSSQKREQVKRGTVQNAQEVAARLHGLLESPPYSDSAKLWKLYGETSLWIADLSVAPVFSRCDPKNSRNDENPTVESPVLPRNASKRTSSNEEDSAGQERQKALAEAEEAFRRARICGDNFGRVA